MTWFADLSPCTYHDWPGDRLAVGWLDIDHPFEQGPVEPPLREGIFIERLLFAAAHRRVDQFRGYHLCQFCTASVDEYKPVSVEVDGEAVRLGSANVGAVARDGRRRYIAPDLVVHYVVEHGYRPPREFVDAVILGEICSEPRDAGRVAVSVDEPDRPVEDAVIEDLVFGELARWLQTDRSCLDRAITLKVTWAGRILDSIPEQMPALFLQLHVEGPSRRNAWTEWAPTERATAEAVESMITRDPVLLGALLEAVAT